MVIPALVSLAKTLMATMPVFSAALLPPLALTPLIVRPSVVALLFPQTPGYGSLPPPTSKGVRKALMLSGAMTLIWIIFDHRPALLSVSAKTVTALIEFCEGAGPPLTTTRRAQSFAVCCPKVRPVTLTPYWHKR